MTVIADIYAVFVASALSVMLFIACLNVLIAFPRLGQRSRDLRSTPSVSVLIPARNEAAVIQHTLQQVFAQDYPDFEVLLLDDHSDDGTGDLARALNDPRLTVIAGAPLPDGWMGKNWACHQLAQRAQGELLAFTDADVAWRPGALRGVVAEMQHADVDLLTVWPTQITVTWAERLVVPLMALAIVGYLPVLGTHTTRWPPFAAACGQCMLWRRSAYDAAGGHNAVRDNVLEDVTLARRLMRAGGWLRMLDGGGMIACRMYTGWPSVRDGYAKNILAGYGGSIPVLLLATVFHWAVFIVPWLWLLLALLSGASLAWPLALIVLGVGLRMLTAVYSRQRPQDAVLMPVSAFLMTLIALRSVYWQVRYGGPNWKGRVVKKVTA